MLSTRMPHALAALAVGGGLLMLGQVLAHHSTVMFDSDNPIELRGTVVELQFTNPHTLIILEVRDESGNRVVWELEGANVRGMLSRGWTANTLQPGDEITVLTPENVEAVEYMKTVIDAGVTQPDPGATDRTPTRTTSCCSTPTSAASRSTSRRSVARPSCAR
jgi:hypothetical protein